MNQISATFEPTMIAKPKHVSFECTTLQNANNFLVIGSINLHISELGSYILIAVNDGHVYWGDSPTHTHELSTTPSKPSREGYIYSVAG
jgi:hypothetical protein